MLQNPLAHPMNSDLKRCKRIVPPSVDGCENSLLVSASALIPLNKVKGKHSSEAAKQLLTAVNLLSLSY